MISEKADNLVERFESESKYYDGEDNSSLNQARVTLRDYIASLELQLSEAQARLAGYEEGYDPKVKLPKDRQTVIAKEVRDDQPIYWDVEFIKGDDKSLWVNWAFAEPSDISEIVRWFPLPGAKEEK